MGSNPEFPMFMSHESCGMCLADDWRLSPSIGELGSTRNSSTPCLTDTAGPGNPARWACDLRALRRKPSIATASH
jgi:hypothetical protein